MVYDGVIMTFLPFVRRPPVASMESEAARKRVLVVDDDPVFLGIVERWLVHSGYEVRTVLSGLEAIPLVRQHDFDVILTDLRMPDLNGLQLLRILKDLRPEAIIIFLSGEGTMEEVIEALRFGRSFDFLRKPLRSLNHLNIAIETALEQRAQPTPPRDPVPNPVTRLLHSELSARELEIVQLAAQGCDNKEIAEHLFLSDKTVRNHLSRIYQKLGVTNRMQAVMHCKEQGLI